MLSVGPYRLTGAEYVQAVAFMSRKVRMVQAGLALFVLALTASTDWLVFGGDRSAFSGFLQAGTVFLNLAAVAYAVVVATQSRRAARRLERLDGGSESVTRLSDEGVEDSSPGKRVDLAWDRFSGVLEVRDLVLLLGRDQSYTVFVPKRAFATPEDRGRFVGFAGERIAAAGGSPEGLSSPA